MLKSVLYILLLLTTTLRLADIIYLLSKESTNLPMLVFIVTSVTVLYGIVLLVKKLISTVRLKQFMVFFILQTVAFALNLIYVAHYCPLKISVLEMLAVGTFLDILINCGAVYLCVKQMRGRVLTVGVMQ